jgi:hypothetical protein
MFPNKKFDNICKTTRQSGKKTIKLRKFAMTILEKAKKNLMKPAALGAIGLASMFTVACGDSSDDNNKEEDKTVCVEGETTNPEFSTVPYSILLVDTVPVYREFQDVCENNAWKSLPVISDEKMESWIDEFNTRINGSFYDEEDRRIFTHNVLKAEMNTGYAAAGYDEKDLLSIYIEVPVLASMQDMDKSPLFLFTNERQR